MNRPLSIATLFAVSACGGPTTLMSNQNSCTITISGAETANVTNECTPAAVLNNVGETGFTVAMSDPSFGDVQFSGVFDNASFRTGSYDETSFKEAGTTLQNTAGNAFWAELVDADAGTGTVNLVITSIGTELDASQGSGWFGGHGSLDATLPAVAGTASTGTATVHMTF